MHTVECNANCPACGVRFVQLELSHGVVAGCTTCGGMWVDNDVGTFAVTGTLSDAVKDFAQALADCAKEHATAVSPPGGYRKRSELSSGARGCPVCAQPLLPRRLRDGDVEVDLCKTHGTFFDVYELVTFAQSVEVRAVGAHAQRLDLDRRLAEAEASSAAARLAGDVLLTAVFGPPKPRWF